ncbi:class A beta-lactamase [Robertkochia sediminum]|uniref:class A beta-lactamase n=1 Tax=Robertkochia sediminum TaxID=2785326 RepID=UPI001933ED43|nr:class A beta-lactamase [Robertkochia sediminum]MBL7472217.1 class A beta-lactamase [Robertkochia sediminum]
MKQNLVSLFTVVASMFITVQPAYAQEQNVEAISQKIEKLSERLVGRIGVASQEIGSDKKITINGDEQFVMASTYKVAIAVALLNRVDKGELKLTDLMDVEQETMVTGDGAIAVNFVHPGIKLSVANLIEAMITLSDNTATDACLKLAGGPEAVTKKMHSIGITELRVDRYTSEILRDFYGLPDKAYASVLAEAIAKDPTLASKQPLRNLEFEQEDPRDQSSPNAMLQLLLAVDSGKALSEKSREFLLATMSRTRTGSGRLKGLLPKGTPVAHKTGTIGGVANDVGYVTLPDGRRFAIVVFTKSSTTTEADRDRAIAEVTRTLYDFYYLKP